MTERTAIERLADDIDKRLANGERTYLIRGAELDWVRDAIRESIRTHGESAPTSAKTAQVRTDSHT